MHVTHLLFSVLWCIHGSLLIDGLKFVQNSDTFEDLLDYPDGMDLSDVQEWLVEFVFNTSHDVFQAFCLPLNASICTPITWGPSTMMIRVSAGMVELRNICSSYLTWIRVISPEFDIYLVPDDMIDNSEDFLQLQDQEFGSRAASALDKTRSCTGDTNCAVCNGDADCAADNHGHGTHCAGTAAGSSYEVAPSASIRSVKVLSDQGSGSWSWTYEALDWLATSTVRPAIASMSLGGPGNSQAMRDAVDAAVNGGVVVVTSGGNKNSDACGFSPAFVPSVITVGSSTSLDARSSFSNYGSCTDIWAPGSSILSASHRSDSGSVTLWGTSMACPHVSGGAALVLEADPSKRSSEVLAELLSVATMNALTGLQTGDTNALLNVVGMGSTAPSPTSGCVHQVDCDVSPWCSDTSLDAWCRTQAAPCPAPYCASASSCTDNDTNCGYWAGLGFCSSSSIYYDYMQQTCCSSCRR